MLYTASPIFHRNVFQKPISHTNNKLNEHGGGACDDLRSRVFYNIVIHIRQGSGDTRGMSQDQESPKVQKPNDGKPKRNSKKTLKHPSRAQRVASPRIARERVLIRPVARDVPRDAVPRDVARDVPRDVARS